MNKVKRQFVLFVLAVMFGALIAGFTGCSFDHRGQTTFGFLTDIEKSSTETSTTSVKRPARD